MRAVPAEIARQIGVNVPGLVLAIVQRNELVVSEAWGVADIRSGAPNSPVDRKGQLQRMTIAPMVNRMSKVSTVPHIASLVVAFLSRF